LATAQTAIPNHRMIQDNLEGKLIDQSMLGIASINAVTQ
jgi:hypothetical protein